MRKRDDVAYRKTIGLLSAALIGLCGNSAAHAQTPVPHDLSPWSMFMAADIVVKGVMTGLAAASLLAWTLYLGKLIELGWLNRRVRMALRLLGQQPSLAAGAEHLKQRRGVSVALIDAAQREIAMSELVPDKQGIKERVQSRLAGIVAKAARSSAAGTGILASIGSTAPFVGLFGTVWGIMNSFISISKSQTTNLAVVAPGIAEALLATAIGLVAAIPAVLFYNQLTRVIGGHRALANEVAEEVMRLVSRDLDRNATRIIRFQEASNGR